MADDDQRKTQTVADLVAILLTYPNDAKVWITRGDSPFSEFVRFSADPDQLDAAYLLIETPHPGVAKMRSSLKNASAEARRAETGRAAKQGRPSVAPGSTPMGPWSPDQCLANKVNVIPPEVFQIVNMLLAERYDGMSVTLLQREVAKRVQEACKDLLNPYWLRFEIAYRDRGWDVVYCPPSDGHDGSWTFRARRNL